MTTVDHMDVSILCSIPHGLNLKKSLKIWHNGWKLSTAITNGICTKQAQDLHRLRCFSKRELWNSSEKGKIGEIWSFVLYDLQSTANNNPHVGELLHHGRYLKGNYLIAITKLQTLQSKRVGKKAL